MSLRCTIITALLMLVSAAQASPAFAAYEDTIMGTPGLVAYWRLDETAGTTAADSAGVRNGTYQMSPTLGQPTLLDGGSGSSVSFDGVDDRVRVTDHATLDVTSATVETWATIDDMSSMGQSLVEKSNAYVLRVTSAQRLRATFTTTSTGNVDFSGARTLRPNKRYHLAITYDQNTGQAAVYVNGQQEGTSSIPPDTLNNSALNLFINSTSLPTEGSLDEVALYNRALTPAEIAAHWAEGADTAAPTVTAGTAPAGTVASSDAAVNFTSDQPAATFECSVDTAAYAACSSPLPLTSLTDGAHTVDARALSLYDVPSADTRVASWTVDTTAPTVSFTSVPASVSPLSSGTVTFTSDDPTVTYQCRTDDWTWVTCTNPYTYAGLPDGLHRITVRATDPADNVSAEQSISWTVDTTAPTLTLTAQPRPVTNERAAAFSFTSNDLTAVYQCSLDDGAWQTCQTPYSVADVADGTHQMRIRAVDGAGNRGAEQAVSWTVDTRPPKVTVQPTKKIGSGARAFTVTADKSNVSLECQINGRGWETCSDTNSYRDLPAGSYQLQVRAADNAGNVSDVYTTSWTVEGLRARSRPVIKLSKGSVTCPQVTWTFNDVTTTTKLTRNGERARLTSRDGRWLCRQRGVSGGQQSDLRSSAAVKHGNRLITGLTFPGVITTRADATAAKLPDLRISSSGPIRVIVRLWCRTTETGAACPDRRTMQPPAAAVLRGATATVVPRAQVSRTVALLTSGRNTVDLSRELDVVTLTPGSYKLTVRIKGTGRRSPEFLYRYFTVR